MKNSPDQYSANVIENVQKHGFHITCVGVGKSPAFCYSTGIFTTYGIPELIISSQPPGLSGEFMHAYVKRFARSSLPHGTRIQKNDEPFDYFLIPVDAGCLTDYVLATIKYYADRSFEYLQLVFPDPNLKFPHEDGYEYDQEILGDYSVITA